MAVKVKLKRNLEGFCLDVEFKSNSSRIGILGASGSGKSMTLKGIAGIEQMDECYVEINGRVLADSNEKLWLSPQKRRVGYMFQNYALFPTRTVEKNIMAGLQGTRSQQISRAGEMIRKFQLDGLGSRLPGELSGGQQQRVALARIMAYEPELIMLDEPFAALDGFMREGMQQELLEMLKEYQGTALLVSHDRDEIYRFSEEILVMDQGQIIRQGDRREIFHNPGKEAAARLTGCKNIVPVKVTEAHSFEIAAWETEVHVQEKLPKRLDAIGYRAHDFIPIWGEREENCIALEVKSSARLPFERRYYLKSSTNDISWFVQRETEAQIAEKGLPQFLKIDPERILYLEK